MEKQNILNNFLIDYNCAQSVINYLKDDLTPEELQLLINATTGISAGIRTGYACGAIVGASIVLSTKINNNSTIPNKQELIYDLTKQFVLKFEEEYGSCNCADLLGSDMRIQENFDNFVANKMFHKICPSFVDSASSILSEILTKYNL